MTIDGLTTGFERCSFGYGMDADPRAAHRRSGIGEAARRASRSCYVDQMIVHWQQIVIRPYFGIIL